MKGWRFYFADAAAEGYLQSQAKNKQLTELINRLAEITADLNQTIMLIVDRFTRILATPIKINELHLKTLLSSYGY